MNLLMIILLVGVLLYVVFPRDLIPDFLIGPGWLDDLALLYMFWRYYRRQKGVQRPAERSEQAREEGARRQQDRPGEETRPPQDPYTILGVAPDASRDEIKSAYRRLAAQYHPDKVQHLGAEFQELAETRFKEIQQAYDQLMRG